MGKLEQIIMKVANQIPADIKWMLIGSSSMYLQGYEREANPPKDIDILVSSAKELDLLENIFKVYITKARSKISTGGEQIEININGMKAELFYENAVTYSEWLNTPIFCNIENVSVSCISPENELVSKTKPVSLRGLFGDDENKIKWLEMIVNQRKANNLNK